MEDTVLVGPELELLVWTQMALGLLNGVTAEEDKDEMLQSLWLGTKDICDIHRALLVHQQGQVTFADLLDPEKAETASGTPASFIRDKIVPVIRKGNADLREAYLVHEPSIRRKRLLRWWKCVFASCCMCLPCAIFLTVRQSFSSQRRRTKRTLQIIAEMEALLERWDADYCTPDKQAVVEVELSRFLPPVLVNLVLLMLSTTPILQLNPL